MWITITVCPGRETPIGANGASFPGQIVAVGGG